MKEFKLKKLLTVALTAMIIATIFPVGASAAWKQDSNGWWNTEENSYSTGWKNIDSNWYYFTSNGYMKTGWVNDGGKWYFMQPSGAMKTGWLSNNGVWYYLNASGDMKTGLVEINNKTYYLSESGAMKTGNVTVNGQTYTFAASGEKINSTVANPTTTNSTAPVTDTSNSSAGGSEPSSDDTTSSYESLYGTWTVTDYIASASKTLSKEEIADCLGQQFTIAEDSISATTSDFGTITIPNPKVKESTMTASEFNKKWGTDINDTVQCVSISYSGYSVRIFIADGNTYALLKGSLFQLG